MFQTGIGLDQSCETLVRNTIPTRGQVNPLETGQTQEHSLKLLC